MAALSISAALVGRERTGEGCFLDLSMLEASMSAMGWTVSHYLISGVRPAPTGQQNVTAAPSGTFDTADGPLNIAANRQTQFEKLCELLERTDLLTDPRFADREARKHHRDALNDELNHELRKRSAAEWERLLPAIGVPAARILSVPQAVESEQLTHRGFFTDVPFPGNADRVVRASGNGVLINGEPLHPSGPPPVLGEHNAETRDFITRWRDGDSVPVDGERAG
jgi:crotonobetainyl-CoA:carnitine CoA-transferase CaiB-like acyl-CoA transferase